VYCKFFKKTNITMIKKIKYVSVLCCAIGLFIACKNDKKPSQEATTPAENVATLPPPPSSAEESLSGSIDAKEDTVATKPATKKAAPKKKEAAPAKKALPPPPKKATAQTTKPAAKPTTKPATKPAPKPFTKTDQFPDENIIKRNGKDDVFKNAEVKPQYPGGEKAMMKYLKKNIKYPSKAKEDGVKGQVFVRFVVEKDGSVADVNIAKGVSPALDNEAKRVVSAMPKWTAGKQNSKPVAVQYTLPIRFELVE
jgi:periplasmic protein TonB